ncbi:MAG TPA: DMT family transporter [Pyrinomonadaceae bacterium]
MKIFLYTVLALIAFAANSLLCRLALSRNAIDAATFSAVRLASGAIILLIVVLAVNRKSAFSSNANAVSAFWLFLYAIAFSFAYLSLSAGTGALILFGAVQATMIIYALFKGERFFRSEWLGLLLAIAGLIYLLLPGLSAPSLSGASLMLVAGIAWGFYSLLGRSAQNPLTNTANNFIYSLPFVFAVNLVILLFGNIHVSTNGILLAILSGAVTSGLGYVIWYAALRGLTSIQAAMVQLAVPVLAAISGVIILSETLSLRLIFSAIMILGGIALAVLSRQIAKKRE